MPPKTSSIAKVQADRALKAEQAQAKTDLFHLATERMGMDLLSEEWHLPICRWFEEQKDHKFVAFFSPRTSYKSTLQVARIVQDLLNNPEEQIMLISHKLTIANELVNEVAHHIQKNVRVREMLPEDYQMRSNDVRFLTGGSANVPAEFSLPLPPGKHRRHPSLRAGSIAQKLTGMHPTIVYLDDIIDGESLKEMSLEDVEHWVTNTLMEILDLGKLRVIGTLWDLQDWYHKVMQDTTWVYQKRAILENENGEPDYEGQPIKIYKKDALAPEGKRFLTQQDVEDYKIKTKSNFYRAYMNDPKPQHERPWKQNKERLIDSEYVPELSKIAVLVDPAPLGEEQTLSRAGYKKKDASSIAVVGYARANGRMIRILLDGKFKKDWTLDELLLTAKNLAEKYEADIIGLEEGRASALAAAFYRRDMEALCRKSEKLRGVHCVSFKSTQQGKNRRILDLAAINAMGDFWISKDECDGEFLSKFLEQARTYPSTTDGHDDVIDSVAYMDDPAVAEHVPKPIWFKRTFRKPKPIKAQPRYSRYIAGV